MRKRLSFFVVLLLFAALTAEAALRIAARLWPKPDYELSAPLSLTVPDDKLGVRGNPAYPGHDAKGFRNQRVPNSASVVILGDSQTYGVGVLPEQAWPQQSERLSRQAMYSMALGSYGPTHSLLLLDEALALHPKLVIEAFYAGNDLFDSYSHVYRSGQLAELKAVDGAVLRAIDDAEAAGTLEEKTKQLLQSALLWTERPPPPVETVWDRWAAESQLVRLGREIGHRVALARGRYGHDPRQFDEAYWATVRREAQRAGEQRLLVDVGGLRTVLTPAYRLCAVDLSDPRIGEGLRISIAAVSRMNERVRAVHAVFAVLLIPTKESVFGGVVGKAMPFTPDLRRVVENEDALWRRVKQALERDGIPVIEALPALQARVAAGEQPYPVSWDGHPNAIGHRTIAELIASATARLIGR